jgi:hypothetical protein
MERIKKEIEEKLKSFWASDSTKQLDLDSLTENERKIVDKALREADIMREEVKRYFAEAWVRF